MTEKERELYDAWERLGKYITDEMKLQIRREEIDRLFAELKYKFAHIIPLLNGVRTEYHELSKMQAKFDEYLEELQEDMIQGKFKE